MENTIPGELCIIKILFSAAAFALWLTKATVRIIMESPTPTSTGDKK